MRVVSTLFAACLLSAQCLGAQRVTVEQLQRIVAEQHAASDKKAAQKLDDVKLDERLAEFHFAQLAELLPGPESRRKLRILADESAFLKLPAADIVPSPAPDIDRIRKILSHAAEFVASTVNKLPDFMATRVTTRFRDYTPPTDYDRDHIPMIVTPGIYHLADSNQAGVRYRNGREEEEALPQKKGSPPTFASGGVTNLGLFGPLLAVVMADILRSKVAWGYWEQGPSGALAVFRFFVPSENSRYKLTYCCVADKPFQTKSVEFFPPYHGEISIDPESGAVYRLAVQTSVKSTGLISRADVLLEYNAVQIGPRKYFCPLHSASIFTGIVEEPLSGEHFIARTEGDPGRSAPIKRGPTIGTHSEIHADARQVTWINDTVFQDYHVFASELRIVPDGGLQ